MLSYIKTIKPNVSKDKGKAPEIPASPTVSTEEAQTEETKSPVLSSADERYFSEELEKADVPNVIFPGSVDASGATTPAEPAAPIASVAEPEIMATEKAKIPKTEELMGAISSRWDGLKHTVSSAAEQHRKKAAEKAAEDAAKEEEKRKLKKAKEKEKAKVYERPEDELTEALEHLNLTAEEVILPHSLRLGKF